MKERVLITIGLLDSASQVGFLSIGKSAMIYVCIDTFVRIAGLRNSWLIGYLSQIDNCIKVVLECLMIYLTAEGFGSHGMTVCIAGSGDN